MIMKCQLHRVRKKRPPKHVQITLWIENNSHHFSLYHEKLSICNVFVKFHDKQPVHCWDIAFYKKMVENCRRQHCQLTRARKGVMLTYARQYWRQAHCASPFTWLLHKQRQNGNLISRENRMLIKVLHQEKGSRKLLAKFPNKAIEMIPTVFIVLETCIFSVSS